jgi:hypothetical protein
VRVIGEVSYPRKLKILRFIAILAFANRSIPLSIGLQACRHASSHNENCTTLGNSGRPYMVDRFHVGINDFVHELDRHIRGDYIHHCAQRSEENAGTQQAPSSRSVNEGCG